MNLKTFVLKHNFYGQMLFDSFSMDHNYLDPWAKLLSMQIHEYLSQK